MTLMVLTLFGLLIVGTPIGVAIGLASFTYLILYTSMDPALIASSFFQYLNGYSFMAVPFFMLAGLLMEKTGLMKEIFNFAAATLGWVRGGLGAVSIVTSALLAALTGSAVASASALAIIAIPRMLASGYSKKVAAGIVCAGGTMANLIPPSIWLILYGIVTDTSVASLFFAGIIPGLILTVILVVINAVNVRNEPIEVLPFNWSNALHGLVHSLAGLGLPVVVLGGLYGGIFNPTESGAAACLYALLYGYISRKGRFTKELVESSGPALRLTAMVFFMMGAVGVFQTIAASEFWPQKLAAAALSLGLGPIQFLFGYMFAILILGCFLDGASMILLTVPVVFPIGLALGINPLHMGILLVLNCQLGTITPPVGLNLYAVSGVSGIPVSDVLRGTTPYFLGIFAFLVFMIYAPQIATWLPGILFRPVVFG